MKEKTTVTEMNYFVHGNSKVCIDVKGNTYEEVQFHE